MRSVDYLKKNNVNVDQSLELFGDMETYNETLREFQKGIDGKMERIDKFFKDSDMPNYAILVHSLKSDCKYFGFMELADLAYQHELESKANNYNFVSANYDKLVEDTKKVINIVNEYLDGEDTPEVVQSPVVEEQPLNPVFDGAPTAPITRTEDDTIVPVIVQTEPVLETVESVVDSGSEDIILIADDSEVIRIFVKKIFDEKYELAFAENGQEAIDIITDHKTDGRIKAILLDLNMPRVDGFAVLDYLKENALFGKMPVSIISGDSSSDAINKAFTYGIVDMINKPFSEEKIRSVVEKTINF